MFGQSTGRANDITTFVSLAQTDGDVGGSRSGELASRFSINYHHHQYVTIITMKMIIIMNHVIIWSPSSSWPSPCGWQPIGGAGIEIFHQFSSSSICHYNHYEDDHNHVIIWSSKVLFRNFRFANPYENSGPLWTVFGQICQIILDILDHLWYFGLFWTILDQFIKPVQNSLRCPKWSDIAPKRYKVVQNFANLEYLESTFFGTPSIWSPSSSSHHHVGDS